MNTLEKLLVEIQNLQQAKEILEEVWMEVGPYNSKLSTELTQKLCNYFKFDDSE